MHRLNNHKRISHHMEPVTPLCLCVCVRACLRACVCVFVCVWESNKNNQNCNLTDLWMDLKVANGNSMLLFGGWGGYFALLTWIWIAWLLLWCTCLACYWQESCSDDGYVKRLCLFGEATLHLAQGFASVVGREYNQM